MFAMDLMKIGLLIKNFSIETLKKVLLDYLLILMIDFYDFSNYFGL